ncbi:MAG: hypothetical protein ACPHO6_03775 [Candidatus Latescibacterota bacterium]
MKPGTLLINTARGDCVDLEALFSAISIKSSNQTCSLGRTDILTSDRWL